MSTQPKDEKRRGRAPKAKLKRRWSSDTATATSGIPTGAKQKHQATPQVQIVGIARRDIAGRHIKPNLLLALQDENDPTERLHMLRDMPGLSLKVRRQLRAKMQLSNVKLLAKIKDWKHKQSRKIKNFFKMIQSVFQSLKLWRKAIKRIEGEYGTAVGSYFIFLRWLFYLNTVLSLLLFFGLLLPQYAVSPAGFDAVISGNASAEAVAVVSRCSDLYAQQVGNRSVHWMTHVVDTLQGKGWIERSFFFYGHYENSRMWLLGMSYNIPLTYLLSTFIYLSISMAVMVKHTGMSLRSRVLTSDAANFKYSNSVFCGWDYGVNNPQAVGFNHNAIFGQLLSDIFEERYKARREQRSLPEKISLYATRAFMNVCVVIILATAFFLIYTSTQEATKLLEEQTSVFITISRIENSQTSLGKNIRLFYEFLPSLVMTSLGFVIPRVFSRIVVGEDYSTEFATRITLFRTVFLKLTSPAIHLGTLYLQVSCKPVDSCNVGVPNKCRRIRCWETYVGQQIYKVIILDLITILFVIIFIDFPRRLLVTYVRCRFTRAIGRAKFNTNKCVLNLVFCQSLCWVGVFFSPLIAIVSTIKLLLVFYLRLLTCVWNFEPPERTYQASKLHAFFITLLMAAFIVCCAPIIFAIWTMPPSTGCGPFRYYTRILDVFIVVVAEWPSWFRFAVSFLTSPGFFFPVVLIILLLLYYFKKRTSSYKATCRILQEQLVTEVNIL